MIEKIMFWAILGHFVGDYLMQPKKMALGKSAHGFRGMRTCAWHCLVYTWAVAMAVVIGQNSWGHHGNIWVWPMVFLTHYPIDRWSLGGRWLQLIKGRPLIEVQGVIQEYAKRPEVLASQHAFAAIVYTVVDNTMHIVLMTAGFAALLHWEVL